MKEKEAELFLENLAKEKHISADTKLINTIQAGKGYLAPELRKIFDSWYDQKLKTEIYPQYQDILAINAEKIKVMPKGTAYERLQGMVGITPIKEIIEKALNYYKLQKIYREKRNENRTSCYAYGIYRKSRNCENYSGKTAGSDYAG